MANPIKLENVIKQMEIQGASRAQVLAVDIIYRACDRYREKCVDEQIQANSAMSAFGECLGNCVVEFINNTAMPPGYANLAIDVIMAHFSNTLGTVVADLTNSGDPKFQSIYPEKAN